MAALDRLQIEDLSGGVQAKTTLALMKSKQVLRAHNAEFDSKIGAITGRKGSVKKSAVVATQRVLNLDIFVKPDGTKKFLALSDDGEVAPKTDLYVSAAADFAGAWSKTLEDLTTILDAWGSNFATKYFIFNGTDTPKNWDGTTWADTTNAPTSGKFPEVYRQRLYVLSETAYLHYSDTINSAGTDFTTTTWSNRGINPNDGQRGKRLLRFRGKLIIFKTESIYKYDGTNDPESSIEFGTHSSKSPVINGDLFFHHPTGIYQMGAGDPVLISRPVQKYLEGMSSANWENVAGGRDLENVYFWIGDVTINDEMEFDYGETFTDVVLKYNIFNKVWTVITNWNARVFCYDKNNGKSYFGTAAGKIFEFNIGYSDTDGTDISPINFDTIFCPEDSGYPEKYKKYGQIWIVGKYNSEVQAGASYEELQGEDQFDCDLGLINRGITAKECWIAVRESYSDRPPRIETLIFDQVELLDDAN